MRFKLAKIGYKNGIKIETQSKTQSISRIKNSNNNIQKTTTTTSSVFQCVFMKFSTMIKTNFFAEFESSAGLFFCFRCAILCLLLLWLLSLLLLLWCICCCWFFKGNATAARSKHTKKPKNKPKINAKMKNHLIKLFAGSCEATT